MVPAVESLTTHKNLRRAIAETFPRDTSPGIRPLVVLTGGEPALQVDSNLIEALHEHDFEIAIETNGTLPLPEGIRLDNGEPQGEHGAHCSIR